VFAATLAALGVASAPFSKVTHLQAFEALRREFLESFDSVKAAI
jgi:hypothetical protein